MSKSAVEQIIGRAVLDEKFRQLLFSDPDKALAGYDLTPEERKGILALIKEETPDTFSSLGERITKGKWIV